MTVTAKVLAGVSVFALRAVGGVVAWSAYHRVPLPVDDRCAATVKGATATLDPGRAYYAALISGVSVKRGLAPRAGSIALATAFQESGMRNLDYGHADSIGLFQQRPSKGWGTIEEIMDPWYSATAFYKALVKVKGWEEGDINDVAQKVQRSAHPEAYRKHVEKSRTLASSLTGQTPASFSCAVRSPGDPDPEGMASFLKRTFGKTVELTATDAGLTATAKDAGVAWSIAHAAVAGTGRYGLSSVSVGRWTWTHDPWSPAAWHGPGNPDGSTSLTLTFQAG
jgi:hypothetical protein